MIATPKDLSYIVMDSNRLGLGRLIHTADSPCDEPCIGWPGCDFRMETHTGGFEVGVNVLVTSRKVTKSTFNTSRVRVQVEFVGDCEPSTFARGWMYV